MGAWVTRLVCQKSDKHGGGVGGRGGDGEQRQRGQVGGPRRCAGRLYVRF